MVLANGSLSSVHPNPTQLLPVLNVAKVGLLKKIALKINVVDLDPDRSEYFWTVRIWILLVTFLAENFFTLGCVFLKT